MYEWLEESSIGLRRRLTNTKQKLWGEKKKADKLGLVVDRHFN